MAVTATACEHCHADLTASDIAEPSTDTLRCKRCGGRALRNRTAVTAVFRAK